MKTIPMPLWKRVLSGSLALLAVLLVFADVWLGNILTGVLQMVSGHYQYPVKIERIDSRIYAGRLSLHGIVLKDGSRIGHVNIAWPWRDMLAGDMHQLHVRLQGADIGHGFMDSLPSGLNKQTSEAPADTPLTVGLMEIMHSRVSFRQAGLSGRLDIPWLRLGDGEAGKHAYHIQAKLKALLSDADARLQVDGIDLDGRLTADVGQRQAAYAGHLELAGMAASDAYTSIALDHISMPVDFSVAPKGKRVSWRLAHMDVATDTRIRVSLGDEMLPAILVHHVSQSGLGNEHPDMPIKMALDISLGEKPEIGRMKATGHLLPFMQPVRGEFETDLDLEVAPLSSFAETQFGLNLDSGRLKMQSKITVENSRLQADSHLILNRLRVSQADAGLTARLTGRIGLSPDAALDLLRDSNDRIELNIPVSWHFKQEDSGLKADLSEVYAEAMLGAMRKA
ncbi:MAG: DUF748 domain-containing protein, partial [Mariprofundaceae bacterium]